MIKVDKKKWDASLKKYLENPTWKKIYDNAPSEECKDYWGYSFYYSKYYNPDDGKDEEFDELRDYYYDRLSVDDWKYIKSNIGNSPFVGYINQRIKEIESK